MQQTVFLKDRTYRIVIIWSIMIFTGILYVSFRDLEELIVSAVGIK